MTFTRRETAILALSDFLLLAVSLWGALALRNLAVPGWGYFGSNLVPFLPIFLLSIIVFYVAGLYEKQTRLVKRDMGIRIVGAQLANVGIAMFLFFIIPLSIAPKTILAIYLFISVPVVSVWRFYRSKRERVSGGKTMAVLVVGGPAAREVFDEVNGNDRYPFSFEGQIDPSGRRPEDIASAVAIARQSGARVIVIDSYNATIALALPALYGVAPDGATFLEFAAFYEDVFDRVPLDHISHAWLLESMPERHTFYNIAKRIFDLTLGVIVLAAASPFILIAAALLSLSGGPAFIFNERVGEGGRHFHLVKLRTMLINDHGDPALRAKNRVTKLGALLRKSRIDELPQLWNVLVGDVSFIGPRPELPSLAAVYERELPYYQMRHAVSPGLSGWAQLHHYDAPKGAADVEKTRVKLSYDLYYLKRRSLGLDLAIALKTVRALLSFSGK